jgi:2C-methyl-D-erythritol 2,4-cyclodiphosphate synthase
MPAPIDYGVQIADPTQSFLSAFQAGASIQDAQFKQQQQQQQLAQQKMIQEGFNKLRQPGATAADYANLSMMLPEAQAKAVRESFGMLSGERQQTALQQSGQVFSAFKSGKPDIAIGLLEQQIEGKRNSGDEAGAKFLETWRDVAKVDPKATEDYFGFTISQIPGGDKIITGAIALGGERRTEALAPAAQRKAIADADAAVAAATTAQATATNAAEKAKADADKAKADAESARIKALYAERTEIAGLNKTNWDIKNLDSQIRDRAAKLNLDRLSMEATVADKLSSIQARLTEIPEGARKLINESATAAAGSKQSATQYNDLANRILSAEGGKGSLTTASEWFAKAIGNQDAWTQIRNEYTRVRNSVAIKALPPGVATDKDIELALKGIPPENANSATLASFLRGSAKLQDIDSSINNAKTDWLSQNNGLLTRAKGTFIAGDYATKPGETFNDFAQRIVGDVSKRYAPQQAPSLVDQIPTDRNPNPKPPAQVDVRSRADAILSGAR